MTNESYNNLKETLFYLMCGELEAESFDIENEFEDGSECDMLYRELYSHMERLCLTTGLEASMEHIQDCHHAILKHLCLKMFDYGWTSAIQTIRGTECCAKTSDREKAHTN